jgi:L-rhamnose isomerase/sugar isomerase
VNKLTGASPTVALHVLWDLPNGKGDVPEIKRLEKKYGVKAGSINPNLFQAQEYKYGSICNPSAEIRGNALAHLLDSVEIGRSWETRTCRSGWPMDRTIRGRSRCASGLSGWKRCWRQPTRRWARTSGCWWSTSRLSRRSTTPTSRTGAWRWSWRARGPKAKVLVDTGHHLQGCNIEQIVTWLLHLRCAGRLPLQRRKYADDDLTLGSIDPYQVFRIFHEILTSDSPAVKGIAYMIDQSHNLKGKMEAMVQTVVTAQELFAKAALVDHKKLAALQQSCRSGGGRRDLPRRVLDRRAADGEGVAQARKLPAEPLKALKRADTWRRSARSAGRKNAASVSSYA